MKTIVRFVKDENAATAIEYALVVSGIALGILAALNGLGTKIGSTLTTASTALK